MVSLVLRRSFASADDGEYSGLVVCFVLLHIFGSRATIRPGPSQEGERGGISVAWCMLGVTRTRRLGFCGEYVGCKTRHGTRPCSLRLLLL